VAYPYYYNGDVLSSNLYFPKLMQATVESLIEGKEGFLNYFPYGKV